MLALSPLFFSCGGNTAQQENENTENTATAQDTTTSTPEKEETAHKEREMRGFHTFDPDFQTLTVNYDGVIRGVSMLDSKATVKSTEAKAQMIETFNGTNSEMPQATLASETDSQLVYNLAMTDREDAVITYTFEQDKLQEIHLRIHVPDNVSFEAMEEELIQYFTHKHGLPTVIEGRKEVWKVEGSDVHEIDILDKQDGDKFYLEVDVK